MAGLKNEKDKEKVQFNYKDNEKKDIEPLTHLISLAEENNLLYDFVLSDDIKNIAQEVNTENNIILKINYNSPEIPRPNNAKSYFAGSFLSIFLS